MKTIDAYIAQFPPETQEVLTRLRATIRAAAPTAHETIKYGLPTYVLHGNLLHFGAFKRHIGLYPTPSGLAPFSEALAKYASGKGSIQFPLSEPLPYDLVDRIVRHRVAEQEAVVARKKKG